MINWAGSRIGYPRPGVLAKCGAGRIGLITGKARVRYPDGSETLAWIGLPLSPYPRPAWSSSFPFVLETLTKNLRDSLK